MAMVGRRRELLGAAGALVAFAMAGCSGSECVEPPAAPAYDLDTALEILGAQDTERFPDDEASCAQMTADGVVVSICDYLHESDLTVAAEGAEADGLFADQIEDRLLITGTDRARIAEVTGRLHQKLIAEFYQRGDRC